MTADDEIHRRTLSSLSFVLISEKMHAKNLSARLFNVDRWSPLLEENVDA